MPKNPNSYCNKAGCGPAHDHISASENIKLRMMMDKLENSLKEDFILKSEIKTVNGESFIGPGNINIKCIDRIEKTATIGLEDTYTVFFGHPYEHMPYTFTVTNGEKGEKGDTGVGIASIDADSFNEAGDRICTIILSNGTKTTFTINKGEKGDQGAQGIQGEKGDRGEKGDKGDKGDQGVGVAEVEFISEDQDTGNRYYQLKLSDGTTAEGDLMVRSGKKGVGIERIDIDEDSLEDAYKTGEYLIRVILSDGSTQTLVVPVSLPGQTAAIKVEFDDESSESGKYSETIQLQDGAFDLSSLAEKLIDVSETQLNNYNEDTVSPLAARTTALEEALGTDDTSADGTVKSRLAALEGATDTLSTDLASQQTNLTNHANSTVKPDGTAATNPHGITASSLNAYTKGETDNAIEAAISLSEAATETSVDKKLAEKLDNSGDQELSGNLTITDTLAAKSLSISEDATIGNDLTVTGGQTVGGDLAVRGDLVVEGTTYTVNQQSLTVNDNLIVTNAYGKITPYTGVVAVTGRIVFVLRPGLYTTIAIENIAADTGNVSLENIEAFYEENIIDTIKLVKEDSNGKYKIIASYSEGEDQTSFEVTTGSISLRIKTPLVLTEEQAAAVKVLFSSVVVEEFTDGTLEEVEKQVDECIETCEEAYATAIYNTAAQEIQLGKGYVSKKDDVDNVEFMFASAENQALATRSSNIKDGHIVRWDAEARQLVDGGDAILDTTVDSDFFNSLY